MVPTVCIETIFSGFYFRKFKISILYRRRKLKRNYSGDERAQKFVI